MTTSVEWESTKFVVWAEVDLDGGTACLEISSVNIEFELNAIPTCSMSVAVGRRADNVSKTAKIHSIMSELRLQVPIRVYCKATLLSGKGKRSVWPADKFKIFDGYAQGSGFRRHSSGAEFTLYCIHWLADLNFSSSISKMSHPLNPAAYFYPATHGSADAGGGNRLIAGQLPEGVFTADDIIRDFWGEALGKWLIVLSQADRINSQQIFTDGAAGGADFDPGKNDDALRALNKFEPFNGGYVLGTKLSLSVLPPAIAGHIAESISDHVGSLQDAYISATIWDKLAGEFKSAYMYAVVPLVDKALLVPFTPGFNGMPHRKIELKDYEATDLQAAMPRPLRAVGLLNELHNDTGNSELGPKFPGLSGWFDKAAIAPNKNKAYLKGLVMLKEGPPWLNKIPRDNHNAAAATGAAGNPVSTAVSPGTGPGPTDMPTRQVLTAAEPLWDAYARCLYIHEILKGRQGQISGRVRFDIAPGSTLQIEAAEDKFMANRCKPDTYHAEVLRVSTVIDAQNCRGSTSFHLAYVRAADENTDPTTSTAVNPLYPGVRWGGCVLVQNDAFAPLAVH